jgi:glutathione S-transferase
VKLYYFPVAPNPTRVRTYLAEKGIEIESVLVSLPEGEQKSPEHLARNPHGKLPVLEFDDGSFLTESLAIIEYFEEIHPEPPMLGTDPRSRARVRSLERLVDSTVLGAIARIVHATNSPLGLPPVPEIAEPERESLPYALEVVQDRMGDQPFLAGDRPTVPDCTLFAALRFGGFFGIELDPRLTGLTRWLDDFSKRPSANL